VTSKLLIFTTIILASNSRFFDVDDLVQGKSVVENDELKEIDVDDNNFLHWLFDDFELCMRKQCVEVVYGPQPFFRHPFEMLNVNMLVKHVLNHLKNYLITISFHVIDLKTFGLWIDAMVKPM
jgi:hypothetical protein